MNLYLLPLMLCISQPGLSGNVDVDGLGKIALPTGNWTLQRSHISQANAKTPDVFMFRRLKSPMERLSVLRYGGHIAPIRPVYLCNSVGDSSLFGIPHFLDSNKKQRGDGVVHMLRKPDDWYASKIEVSYVYPDVQQTHWMSHAILATQDKSVFVCIHCAPKVLSPEPLRECLLNSRLLSDSHSR
jgi:hypothetical protein